MSGFTKLVPEIVQSSIWNEPSDVRVVWITMLAVKDESGYVRGDAKTLARLANVPLESVTVALQAFQSPDPASHTPDHDGRRIAPLPGGWLVLNSDRYRLRDDVTREQTRLRVKKFREKSGSVTQCNVTQALPSASASASVSVPEGVQGEGDVEGEGIVEFPPPASRQDSETSYLPAVNPADAVRVFQAAQECFRFPDLDRNIQRLRAYIAESLARGYSVDRLCSVCRWATDATLHLQGRPNSAHEAMNPDRVTQWETTMQKHAAQLEYEKKRRNK